MFDSRFFQGEALPQFRKPYSWQQNRRLGSTIIYFDDKIYDSFICSSGCGVLQKSVVMTTPSGAMITIV